MYRFYINTGDPSDDGHGYCDKYHIEANKSLQQIEQAYKDSCELTQLQFNTNTNYTGVQGSWEEFDKRKMVNDYLDNKLTDFHKDILRKFNISDEIMNFEDTDGLIIFFFEFIKLTLKDLEYKVIPDAVLPTFSHAIGYGMYDD